MVGENVTLHTADGLTLSGDLWLPDGEPWAATVVAHPHPLYGGDRHNPVVQAVARALAAAGVAVVTFDFRGVGASAGTHDEGRNERLDLAAALETAADAVDDVPLVAAGYSFGSMVALNVTDARLAGWLALAPPLGRMGGEPAAGADSRPKHLVVAQHDQFCPPAAADAASAGWPGVTRTVVPMADHFLAAGLRVVAMEAVAFVSRLAGR
jgi:alpha/beta superfamily hydrolase